MNPSIYKILSKNQSITSQKDNTMNTSMHSTFLVSALTVGISLTSMGVEANDQYYVLSPYQDKAALKSQASALLKSALSHAQKGDKMIFMDGYSGKVIAPFITPGVCQQSCHCLVNY